MRFNINSWVGLSWPEIEQQVYFFQVRIYKAARVNQQSKVHKLQRLLLKSSSAKILVIKKIVEASNSPNLFSYEKTEIKSILSSPLIITHIKITCAKTTDFSSKNRIKLISDEAKQILAHLALAPEWDARFEFYQARGGVPIIWSSQQAVEETFLRIGKNPAWVLQGSISKNLISNGLEDLFQKCAILPELQLQLQFWITHGLLGQKDSGNRPYQTLDFLLWNIILHTLPNYLQDYTESIGLSLNKSSRSLTYIRFCSDFLLINQNMAILRGSIDVIETFLSSLGLSLVNSKTDYVHTYKRYLGYQTGLNFLGFHLIQKENPRTIQTLSSEIASSGNFITLLTPSSSELSLYKLKLRDIIRQSRGITQNVLIHRLNSIIDLWVQSQPEWLASAVFSNLDRYLHKCLWAWAKRRHQTKSTIFIRNLYWYKNKNSRLSFSVRKGNIVLLSLESHVGLRKIV